MLPESAKEVVSSARGERTLADAYYYMAEILVNRREYSEAEAYLRGKRLDPGVCGEGTDPVVVTGLNGVLDGVARQGDGGSAPSAGGYQCPVFSMLFHGSAGSSASPICRSCSPNTSSCSARATHWCAAST